MDRREADKLNEWGRLNSFRGDITLTYAQFRNHINSLVEERMPCKHVMKTRAVKMCVNCDWFQMID